MATGKSTALAVKKRGNMAPRKAPARYGHIITKSDVFETDIADFIAGHNHHLRRRTPSCSEYRHHTTGTTAGTTTGTTTAGTTGSTTGM